MHKLAGFMTGLVKEAADNTAQDTPKLREALDIAARGTVPPKSPPFTGVGVAQRAGEWLGRKTALVNPGDALKYIVRPAGRVPQRRRAVGENPKLREALDIAARGTVPPMNPGDALKGVFLRPTAKTPKKDQ